VAAVLERTNVTNDDPVLIAKIALAHLKELPDYYTGSSKWSTTRALERTPVVHSVILRSQDRRCHGWAMRGREEH
jgi:hypothetical protein